MSADYRLSPFGSFLGGLTLSRRLYESISANVGGTYLIPARPRSHHPARPPLRRADAPVSAADMNVMTVTFGFTWLY